MTTTQTIAQYAATTRNLTQVEYAGKTSTLTLALNVAMLDEAAQAAYQRIWGVAWEALPMPGIDDERAQNSTAPTTEAPTVR